MIRAENPHLNPVELDELLHKLDERVGHATQRLRVLGNRRGQIHDVAEQVERFLVFGLFTFRVSNFSAVQKACEDSEEVSGYGKIAADADAGSGHK